MCGQIGHVQRDCQMPSPKPFVFLLWPARSFGKNCWYQRNAKLVDLCTGHM